MTSVKFINLDLRSYQMSKSKKNSNANANHKSNQANANKGTKGTNQAFSKAQGNKGTQMNPNRKK